MAEPENERAGLGRDDCLSALPSLPNWRGGLLLGSPEGGISSPLCGINA